MRRCFYKPRNTKNYWQPPKTRRGMEWTFPQSLQKGTNKLQTRNFSLLESWMLRDCISIALSHPLYDRLCNSAKKQIYTANDSAMYILFKSRCSYHQNWNIWIIPKALRSYRQSAQTSINRNQLQKCILKFYKYFEIKQQQQKQTLLNKS